MYCIYTNTNIEEENCSKQHIIPLSLGGANAFTINIAKTVNNELGSKVEGALLNELTMQMKRMHGDILGQSKLPVKLRYIKAEIDNNPIIIKEWSKSTIKLHDPLAKKDLNGPLTMTLKTKIDLYTHPRFLAKIALEAGYFSFGETFVKYADCDTLRKAIFCKDFEDEKLDLRFYDNLHPIETKDAGMHGAIKLLIEQLGGSSVIIGFAEGRIIVSVGILGDYLGTINFKADHKKFPLMEDCFDLGHVILCKSKKLHKFSLREAMLELNNRLKLVNIKENNV